MLQRDGDDQRWKLVEVAEGPEVNKMYVQESREMSVITK